MSNEQSLPVYVVPGTDGKPDLYYLRSYPQSDGNTPADIEITKEQYDAINSAIDSARDEGAASVTPGSAAQNLADQHAAVDPASPDFQGTPAVNAGVAGSAAAPVNQPPIDPGDPTQVPADTSADTPADQGQPETTEPVSETTDAPKLPDQTPSQPEGDDVQSPDAGVPSDQNGTSGEQPTDNPSPTGEGTSVDPNQGGLSDTTLGPIGDTPEQTTDPNAPASGDQPSESGSQTTGSETGSTSSEDNSQPSSDQPVVDPTDPNVVSGQPLPDPGTLNSQPGGIVDPATGLTPDTTDHPVDSGTLPDPTVVQTPPADCPPHEHGSWFAKEKQRILDFLNSEEDRINSSTEPQ